MRVTNNYMTRNYLNNLNNSLSLYNESENKLTTGRKISKMSDDVSAGTRALGVRTQSYKNEQIRENVEKAGESLDVAESNLTSIKDILQSVNEQTMTALNGTNVSASNIFSINFTSLKNQVVEFANCRYNGSYVLGGTNNTTPPFTVEDGNLMYNGVKVNDIQKTEGKFYAGGEKVPQSDSIYIDIGIDLSIKNGEVDPRSAFNMSVSGLDCLGYGTSEITYQDTEGNSHTETVPNNAYDILDEMSKCLDEKDFDRLGALNDHLKETLDGLVNEISDIGIRTNYLDTHTERLKDEDYVLTKIQNNLEYIKDTDELINNKNLEYSWLLTLQFGGKILPQSLMDYIQ